MLYKQFYIEQDQHKKETMFEYSKTYRNHLLTIIRMSKEDYFKKCCDENKKDSKIVWSAIRSIVNVKQRNRCQLSNLIIENKTVSYLSAIANHFTTTFLLILLARANPDVF